MRQLSNKEKLMIESYLDFEVRDLPRQVADYKGIMDTLVILQEYLAKSGITIPSHKFHIDTLISKFIFHSNTIYHLLNGIDLEIKPLKFKSKILDIPSLFVLLRAQLENFLIFDFIYCQSKTPDETIFRYNNWLYSGFISRKDLPVESEATKKVIASDLKEIERLKNFFKNSKYFTSLRVSHQNKILSKGDEKLGYSWVTIMQEAGLGQRTSGSLYKLISAYAHSSSVSIFNFTELKAGYTPNNGNANLIVFLSKIIISKFIVKFKGQIKTVELKYNMLNKDVITLIEFYDSVLKNRPRIF